MGDSHLRYVLKLSKGFSGQGVRWCVIGGPGYTVAGMPLPVRGKLPREALLAVSEVKIIELPFMVSEDRKRATLNFVPPKETQRWAEQCILKAGFFGVFMYITDDQDK